MLNANGKIPRLRTVAEAAQEIREIDAHTAITPYHIRRLCLDGVIPTVKAGKKILLNLDTLLEYMEHPDAERFKPNHIESINGIRRIS